MRRVIVPVSLLICLLLTTGCSGRRHPAFQNSLREYRPQYVPQLAAVPPGEIPADARPATTDARMHELSWLLLAKADADDPSATPKRDAPAGWRDRRGPAYPGDFWRSFGRDAKELPATIWDDTVATFTDKWALIGLSAAAAVGIALDVANTNGCVGDHFQENRSQLNTFWDNVGDVGGNPGLHFGVAGAMYFSSLYRGDVKNYEVSKALINALAVNGLTTLALKGVAGSESPNGDDCGWPSGHTSSTFCLATVMHEAYGPWVGVPLFAFASFVGYERIDARNHDFNDVISGALIGIFIGHVVYQNHEPKILGMDVIPYADPATGSVGIALSKSF